MGASCISAKKSSSKSIQNLDVIEPVKKSQQIIYKVEIPAQSTSAPSTSESLSKSPSSTNTQATASSGSLPVVQKRVRTQMPLFKPKRKQNRLEVFLIQRKEYMQSRGVFVYNSQTTLPPPVISNVSASSLSKRRRNLMASNEINQNNNVAINAI